MTHIQQADVLVLCATHGCPERVHARRLPWLQLPEGWQTTDTLVRLLRRETAPEGGRYIYAEQAIAGIA